MQIDLMNRKLNNESSSLDQIKAAPESPIFKKKSKGNQKESSTEEKNEQFATIDGK